MKVIQNPIKKSLRGTMLGLPIEDANEWANRAYIVFGVIAIIATALALMASFVMWRSSDAISADKDRKLAAFQAESKQTTAKLENETADAQLKQVQAEQKIAELNLSLAKIKMPRRLSFEQARKITTDLLRFKGTPFDVTINQSDPEIGGLLPVVEQTLNDAGWDQKFWIGGDFAIIREGKPNVGVTNTEGLIFLLADSEVEKFGEAAISAASAFTSAGIEASARKEVWKDKSEGGPGPTKGVLHVYIGKKPL